MIKDYFIFDGVSSRDFNVIVDSADVFGKPSVGLSTVKIPGRTGELLIYDNRLENMTVSYQCHCDYRLRSRLDNFVMELASRQGYKRLEDSVFPEHFRRAYFQGPVSTKVRRGNAAQKHSTETQRRNTRQKHSAETHFICTVLQKHRERLISRAISRSISRSRQAGRSSSTRSWEKLMTRTGRT